MKRRDALLACLALFALGCDAGTSKKEPPVRGELGVFFGGQVQERREIPFTLDRTRQTQGFRLKFREPLRAPLEVRWEVDRPGPRGRGRAVELGDARVRASAESFDQEIAFRPGDPLGTWNIRVFAGNELVLDRPLFIYDAAARRAERRAALSKAKPK